MYIDGNTTIDSDAVRRNGTQVDLTILLNSAPPNDVIVVTFFMAIDISPLAG